MVNKMMLFQTDSETRADGSLVLRPRQLLTGQEIGVKKTAEILGYRDRESVYRLIQMGAVKAWKPESANHNGKWRIDLQSVLDYKARRMDSVGGE